MYYSLKNLVYFTEEDLLNVQKWQTATSMMIEGKMRTPYSDSEHKTGEKLKRLVSQIDGLRKELRETPMAKLVGEPTGDKEYTTGFFHGVHCLIEVLLEERCSKRIRGKT